MNSASRPIRVAIVGLGPKGLFALERLLDRAAGPASNRRIDVVVFEPHSAPGAGPVYDPDQPPYLRLNFPAAAVDMWAPTSQLIPPAERTTFVAWCGSRGTDCDPGSFPPRSTVGEYLVDGFATILRHVPPSVRVTLIPDRVQGLERASDRWIILSQGRRTGGFDEVLVCTGHDRSWRQGLVHDWGHQAPLIPSVFPVERYLSLQAIAPKVVVAARGCALTFIDAALALTEGRGGSFEPAEQPHRFSYRPGANDVSVILPFSRTGRLMLPKPDPDLAASIPILAEISEQARDRVAQLRDGFQLSPDLLPILDAAAAAAVLAASDGLEPHPAGLVAHWLRSATRGDRALVGTDPVAELEDALLVGSGDRAPDVLWALGHIWRAVYPAIVERLGGDALSDDDWPALRRLATEMERIAFGPAPVNAVKLLALIDAGRVDLTHLHGGHFRSDRERTWLCSARGEREVDVVLDAVLPGPGALDSVSQLLTSLLTSGRVSIRPGRRGLTVDADGRCRRADGTRSAGLSAVGRVTEDCVIGNDTLNRTLHPIIDRWADRTTHAAEPERVRQPLAIT